MGAPLLGGRLSIIRKLGEGGMGVVYEAFDAERSARVACKMMSRLDAKGIYRIKNEFRALAEVQHPNLVRLYELFVEGTAWFFTMELIEGQERFDTWVRPHGVLDEARLRAAFSQLVIAVHRIHGVGKLHRDLKPSNVLVEVQGSQSRVVVLDYGLTVDSEHDGVGRTLEDEERSGTPAYMAPEQAAGRRSSRATDYYALGVMLFEALTGRLPFEGRSGAILAAKQCDVAPRASALAPAVPADLDELCAALLSLDPSVRPDASALHVQLGLSVEEAQAALGPPSQRPAATDLLGRDLERAVLRAALEEASAGKPVVMFVSGESGIGKSALLAAFTEELRAHGSATVLHGRCYEREHVPFKGFDALIDALCRHLRKLPRTEAAALMPRDVFALARIFPALSRVRAVSEAPTKAVADPQELRRRALEAFVELIGRIRDRGPLVLLIDDLQWIDHDSVQLMRSLLVHGELAPVLLVCAHRSEGAASHALLQSVVSMARDSSQVTLRTLHIERLSDSALHALVRRLLPPDVDELTQQSLAREAQGSPFFALSLARALPLRPKREAVGLADVLALHIASLPAHAQRLLSVLGIAGQPLVPAVAIEAAGVTNGHALLDRLRGEQLVRASFDADGGRTIECYHDKIREQVVAGLGTATMQELALALARCLLAVEGADPELLARLLDLAGHREQAATHAARAAVRAFGALAFERAAGLYARALEHGRFEPTQRHVLEVGRAQALAYAGHGERAAQAFLEASKSTSGEDAQALARRAGEQYFICGDLERGRAVLADALRPIGIAFPRTLASVLASVASSRARLGLRGLRFVPRETHDAKVLRELEVLGALTHSLVRTDPVRAADYCARWILCALKHGHEVELARALAWELGFVSHMGKSEATVAALDKACRELCERTGDWRAAQTLAWTAGCHVMDRFGDTAAALVLFDQSLELLNANASATTSYDRRWTLYFRATCLLLSGRVAEAGAIANAQLADAATQSDRSVSTPFAQTACMAWLAADRPDQAAAVLAQVEAGLRPDEHTLQDLVWLADQPMPALYRGEPRAAWYAAAAHRERYFASFAGRAMLPGLIEHEHCGVAVAAAQHAESSDERRALTRIAERFERRSHKIDIAITLGTPAAALACLRGDRAGAIAALRKRLRGRIVPLAVHLIRRRLGELLCDDEGRALIDEADAALRAGGVLDPARFTAAVIAGVELPTYTHNTHSMK